MVIPASKSNRNKRRLYLGSHSKIGTKYRTALTKRLREFLPWNCLKGSSGKRVSLRSDLKMVGNLLGVEKLTVVWSVLTEAMKDHTESCRVCKYKLEIYRFC